MENGIHQTAGGTIAVGQDATRLFGYVAIKLALKGYINHGIMMNSAYTPTNMCAAISRVTGKNYKRGRAGQCEALADITELLEAAKRAAS